MFGLSERAMKHVFCFLGRHEGNGLWTVNDPTEMEHARKVLRIRAGDAVEVFDGKGTLGRGTVQEIGRDSMSVRSDETRRVGASKSSLGIALGALKPGDLDEVLPALVELGVDKVMVFLQEGTERFRIGEKAHSRWERIILGACKQAKRAWLTQVQTYDDLKIFVKETAVVPATRFVLQPAATRSLLSEGVGDGSVIALLGGERGLTSEEEELLASAGFIGVRIGGHILRARTAAVAAAAILGTRRDDGGKGEVVDSG
jgi:16S rRNA (uracil1498-N3)-methyltransferase